MVVFVVRRVLASLVLLVVSSAVVFALVASSGDPLGDLRTDTSPDRAEKIAHRVEVLHLDQPLPRRYARWLGGAVRCAVPGAGCDLGRTVDGEQVTVLLGQAIGTTARLVTGALVLAIALGVTLGVFAALRPRSGIDHVLTVLALVFYSLPVFWVAVLLKQYLAIGLNDWYADPVLPVPVVAGLAGLTGILGVAVAPQRRRWWYGGSAAVAVFLGLSYLTQVDWFRRPALGPIVIAAGSAAAAIALSRWFAGRGRNGALTAALVTAGVGAGAQFAVTRWLADPTWASWTNVSWVAAGWLAMAAAIAGVFGGQDRRPALAACLGTAVVGVGLVVVDLLLRAVPEYAALVDGRMIATIGSQTPDFTGGFWSQQGDLLAHLLLPTLSIALVSFASYSRYARVSMLEVMTQDYVRTARAKGISEFEVVVRHGVRNAMIPVVTVAAIDFGALVGGALITEYVFGWQGMASLFFTGLLHTDPSPVMGFYLVTGLGVAGFNVLADVAYARLDPRIRLT